MRSPSTDQIEIWRLEFSDLPCQMFGEGNALTRLPESIGAVPRENCRGIKFHTTKESEMYSTTSVDGFPAIQCNGQEALSVWGHDWEFAEWLCAILNELSSVPKLLLSEQDCEWLKEIDHAFGRQVHHA